MSSLSRELVFLILQFLDEEKFKETVHKCVHPPLSLRGRWLPWVGEWLEIRLLYALGDLICRAACFRFFFLMNPARRGSVFFLSRFFSFLGFDELLLEKISFFKLRSIC